MVEFFWNRTKRIETSFGEYLDQVDRCLVSFVDGVNEWLSNDDTPRFDELAERCSKDESRADDLRRAIEHEIYEKSLIPDSRGDVLGLLESLDKIPNRMESVVREISVMHVESPKVINKQLSFLVDRITLCVRQVLTAARTIFGDMSKVRGVVKKIDKLESECDFIQHNAVEILFRSELSLAEKMLYREVVRRVGSIPDIAESVGDRLNITAAKRL